MDIIQDAICFASGIFAGDSGGHDLDHTLRVYRMAVRIARDEGADERVAGLAALLHDVDDHKLSPDTCHDLGNAREFLHSHNVPDTDIPKILTIISQVSFSGGLIPDTLEGKCVQDADRLDAMGAIGIARTFAYGGSKGRRLHDPAGEDRTTSIQHFYDKLLLLKDRMNTPTGKVLAQERHTYMETFLARFYREWAGEIE